MIFSKLQHVYLQSYKRSNRAVKLHSPPVFYGNQKA